MFNKGLKILKLITEKGFEAFMVGGCIRDIIMNVEPHDIDITTNCPIEILETMFKCHYIGNSKSFGIVAVVFEGESFEVAQFRGDVYETPDGKGANSVVITNNFKEDVIRRDFTINGLGMDKDGNVIDFTHGVQDISNEVIRTIGNPFDRFNEDFIRILRAVRFAGKFGFEIEEETSKAMMSFRHHLVTVTPERIRLELFKMAGLSGEKFAKCIEIMDFHGILEIILPEIKVLQDFQEAPMWHPEAYRHGQGTPFCHTLQALKMNKEETHPLYNLSVLFHDIGKGNTHILKDGINRFHSHDATGVELFRNVANRLKFSNFEKDVITFCIKNHMKITHVGKMKKSKVVRLVTHEHYHFLKNTIICDDSCREEAFRPDELEFNLNLAESIREVFVHIENKPIVINGKQVMELLNIKPSPLVGHIIRTVTERFLDSEEVVCIKRLVREVYEESL